jgi:hypothetical protein
MGKTERPNIEISELNGAITALQRHMADVLNRKGHGSFVSSHEILGVLTDERSETISSIQNKAGLDKLRHELLDEAATAIFGVACIDSGTMEH